MASLALFPFVNWRYAMVLELGFWVTGSLFWLACALVLRRPSARTVLPPWQRLVLRPFLVVALVFSVVQSVALAGDIVLPPRTTEGTVVRTYKSFRLRSMYELTVYLEDGRELEAPGFVDLGDIPLGQKLVLTLGGGSGKILRVDPASR